MSMKLKRVDRASNSLRVWCCKCETTQPEVKTFAVLNAAPGTYICEACVEQEGGKE